MNLLHVMLLAIVQGAAELLPVSSSAHVIVASKLLGLDPATPEMTFLIVMLHTGTMFAVILYFWPRWHALIKNEKAYDFFKAIVAATAVTGVVGLSLKVLIEKVIMGHENAEVEQLFSNLPLVALALFSVSVLIYWSGKSKITVEKPLDIRAALKIGLVQAICLPFRGFSRSGATISTGLLLGIPKALAEDFSFALAVVVTPPVVVLQLRRLLHHHAANEGSAQAMQLSQYLMYGVVGMGLSFISGWLALKLLSKWLENSRWHYFAYYCFGLSLVVLFLGLQK